MGNFIDKGEAVNECNKRINELLDRNNDIEHLKSLLVAKDVIENLPTIEGIELGVKYSTKIFSVEVESESDIRKTASGTIFIQNQTFKVERHCSDEERIEYGW